MSDTKWQNISMDRNQSNTMQTTTVLEGEQQTLDAGANFARQLIETGMLQDAVITLSGELGAGKTTFARGFIQACGHEGAVKSPTYTLLELYETSGCTLYHLDLYRLEDPEELEFIGFRDLFGRGAAILVEWPERVPALADSTTIRISIEHIDAASRQLTIEHLQHR